MRLINRKSDDSLAPRRMHVLLLRPVPVNDRFGLGPFFRIEPLGIEYIAAALEQRGHCTTVVDLRYSRSIDWYLRRVRPALVGVACMHALETDEALAVVAHVRRAMPEVFIVVGGHSAAAYPWPSHRRCWARWGIAHRVPSLQGREEKCRITLDRVAPFVERNALHHLNTGSVHFDFRPPQRGKLMNVGGEPPTSSP